MSRTQTIRSLRLLLFSLLCLNAGFVAAHRLLTDLKTTLFPTTGAPIARLSHMETTVRRKLGSSFVWADLSPGAELYRRDSINVGKTGLAILDLADGSQLEVGPDSLLILDAVPPLELKFLRGDFVLRSSEKEFTIRANRDGKPEVKALPMRLVSPVPRARVAAPPGKPALVFFSWTAGNEAPSGRATLELSTSALFPPSMIKRIPYPDQSPQEVVQELSAGRWYWRVSKGAQLSESRAVEIVEGTLPVALYPAAGDTVFLPDSQSSLNFRWQVPAADILAAAESVHLEIARDRKFDQPLVSKMLRARERSFSAPGLEQGDWFWRVQIKYPTFTAASPINPFKVKQGQAVRLISPAVGSSYRLAPLTLSWELPSGGEATFQTQIEKRTGPDSFSSIKELVGEASQLQWQPELPGLYRWRVAAGYRGTWAKPTGWHMFSVYDGEELALVGPNDTEAIRFWTTARPVTFEWKGDPLAQQSGYKYELRISRARDLSSSTQTRTTSATRLESSSLTLSPGLFFWQVRILEPSGFPVKISRTRQLDYGPPPPLKAPVLKEPDDSDVFYLSRLPGPPRLTWSPVKDAAHYTVRIRKASEKAVDSRRSEDTSLAIGDLPSGKYEWTVGAIDPIGRTGDLAEWREFSIELGELLSPPKVKESRVE